MYRLIMASHVNTFDLHPTTLHCIPNRKTPYCNFIKSQPIIKILSLAESRINFFGTRYNVLFLLKKYSSSGNYFIHMPEINATCCISYIIIICKCQEYGVLHKYSYVQDIWIL